MKTKKAILKFEGISEGTPVSLMNIPSSVLRQAATVKDKIGKLEKRFSNLLGIHQTRPATIRPVRVARAPVARKHKRRMTAKAKIALGRTMRRVWREKRKKLQKA
jgi:hypothetical protein